MFRCSDGGLHGRLLHALSNEKEEIQENNEITPLPSHVFQDQNFLTLRRVIFKMTENYYHLESQY